MQTLVPTGSPWGVTDDDFPDTGTPREQLCFLLHYAVLAPSGHNTQPWLFRIGDSVVELHADRTRALPVVDPKDRELTISCGAALFHFRVALRRFGYLGQLETFPESGQPDLLARVRLAGKQPAAGEDRLLFDAIRRRHTNRMRFESRPVPLSVLSTLEEAARKEGASLFVIEPEELKKDLADLVAEGDRTQAADPRFRRELATWLHPNRSRSRDGIPGYAFGFGNLFSHVAPLVLRTFDWGKGQARRDRELAKTSPVLAVLGTTDDSPAAWLTAGQAVARVLLRARADDVWASFLNQPIEVGDLRPRVESLAKPAGVPQLILRMGYGPEVEATPRRSVEQVLAAITSTA